jgi:SAM-dependent methyltransferase
MTTDEYPDHFSGHAEAYASHRPGYPAALYEHLASHVRDRRTCWDCGTGSGQAAVALAAYFEQVVATDASEQQLTHAKAHPNVRYRCARAEASGLPDASVDMVTAAAALHWFDLDRFYAEVRRVSRPGAVIATWSYSDEVVVNDAVTACMQRLADEIVVAYWPAQFQHVRSRYSDLAFPFRHIDIAAHHAEAELELDGFIKHVHTWSGVQRFMKAERRDPVAEIIDDLREAWRDGLDEPTQRRTVRWPLHALVGRVHERHVATSPA